MKFKYLVCLLLLTVLSAAKLDLTVGDTYALSGTQTISRFVNANPDLVDVRKSGNNKLLIKAKKIGAANIYYWTDGQKILVVNVRGRKTIVAKSNANKKNGRFETYFKFDPVNKTPVNQRMMVNSLEYAFLTDSGMAVDFFTRYRQSAVSDGEDVGQIENVSVRLAKSGNWLTVGDSTVKYSELTAPYLEMQGAQGAYRWGNFQLSGFAGKRPGNFWGRQVGENYFLDKDSDVDISGAKIKLSVNNNLDVGLSAMGRNAPSENMLGSYSLRAGEVNYRQGDYHFVYELADSQQDNSSAGAYRGELNYNAERLGWQIAYRDVEPEYRTLSDYFNYMGMQGWSLFGRAMPVRRVSLSGTYENYLQRFEQDRALNPDHNVERLRVRLGLDKIIFFRPSITYYSNYRDDYRTSGMNFNLYEIEILRRYLWAYYDFSTWKYSAPDTEYFNDRALAGLTYRLGWLTLKTEKVNEQSRYVYGGETYGLDGWNIITTLGDFRWSSGVRMSVSYWYQNRKDTLGVLDKNRNSIRLSLGQSVGDLYWYLNGVASRENSLFYEYRDEYDRDGYFYHDELTQSEISGGLVYSF